MGILVLRRLRRKMLEGRRAAPLCERRLDFRTRAPSEQPQELRSRPRAWEREPVSGFPSAAAAAFKPPEAGGETGWPSFLGLSRFSSLVTQPAGCPVHLSVRPPVRPSVHSAAGLPWGCAKLRPVKPGTARGELSTGEQEAPSMTRWPLWGLFLGSPCGTSGPPDRVKEPRLTSREAEGLRVCVRLSVLGAVTPDLRPEPMPPAPPLACTLTARYGDVHVQST
uniref:Uncharacterized protein n=1 Tax=Mustela putorius furo TaxID=9669 RepID=M3XT28_MUSPF